MKLIRFLGRAALFGSLALLVSPLQAAALAPEHDSEAQLFYPDRARSATFGEGEEHRAVIRLRPGNAYRIRRMNASRTLLLVESPSDPEVVGWVRYAPAELEAPEKNHTNEHYSSGWVQLYEQADDLRDDELKEQLRFMNRNSKSLGYSAARTVMYSSLDNRDGWLRCVYTGLKFPAGNRPGHGPGGKTMNCEHTWPQGSFNKQEPMRSDMHHLYPTETRANGIRGHKDFRELGEDEGQAVGSIGARTTRDAFEPPAEHKGNVARALFYFSVKYKRGLPSKTEEVLRVWNISDPVDEAERNRNDGIYSHQNSRNFFVDHPEYVARISDF
jgi:hypothetical protein